MTTKFPPLPSAKFDIVYADPPWDYEGRLQHAGEGTPDTGGATRHYPTVVLSDLKTLDVQRICADDCLLFMWATNPHLDQAVDLGKSWGFSWATVAFVWDKVRVNPGFYTMSQCELCLVFKRGKIPRPRGSRNVRQLVTVKRGAHSRKPDEVRKRIEEMFPAQRKIELFARTDKDFVLDNRQWIAWGIEADGSRTSGATERPASRSGSVRSDGGTGVSSGHADSRESRANRLSGRVPCAGPFRTGDIPFGTNGSR